MDIPPPVPGMVIGYAYLWADEHSEGREEGSKDRPVAIVVAKQNEGGKLSALVVPITHSPPKNPSDAIEIPTETKRRLKLDDQRSWIVITEVNIFRWPGPDIRLIPSRSTPTIKYGQLPEAMVRVLGEKILANLSSGKLRQVPGSE